MSDDKKLGFSDFRKRIGDVPAREFYRSLDELSRSEVFDEFLAEEFPRQAAPLASSGFDRRNFMKLMGASMALAAAACNRPAEKIVPYVKQPENLIPGRPLFFASAMPLSGVGYGVLAESHMGRPTKIEGNPDHPTTLGASNAFMQASVLGLYDPDRSQVVFRLGEISTWSEFVAALQPVMAGAKTNGAGFRLLTDTISSPTLGAQIQQLLAAAPGMKWHQWEPVNRDNVREGLRAAFGGYVNAIYDFTKANVVVALDSDFLDAGPGHLRYARDFASRRRVRRGSKTMNRLYAVEAGPTSTGSLADHRWLVRPSEVEAWARQLAQALGLNAGNGGAAGVRPEIAAMAKDLQANRGASVVIAGDEQPAVVHAIAMAINQALGNVGSTVAITDPIEVAPTNQLESLRQLVTDMNAGAVKALIMIGGNPVYDAPADFNFVGALDKVPFRAHLGHYYNETAMHCHWHVPETHYLESWGDVRGHDGTVSIIQPLIAPLYNGRSPHELLGALAGGLDQSPYDTVRAYWSAKMPGGNFEHNWRQWLNDGVIKGSALPVRGGAASTAIPTPAPQPPANGYELRIVPDPNIYDGRFSTNGWLQELPKPQTKICWENVVLVSPKTAQEIGFTDDVRAPLNNELETLRALITYRGKTLDLPLWVLPGHPDGTLTVYLGFGKTQNSKITAPQPKFQDEDECPTGGVNCYTVRFSDAMSFGPGAQIKLKDFKPYEVACTQEHQSINPKDMGGERGIIRAATIGEFLRHPDFASDYKREEEQSPESMYPPYKYENHAWAMVIDPSVCTGCNGCVIACQAENNIPIVGKKEVHRQREMHWLRIDRYFRGPVENPEVYHQPVPCMQCEEAPCEPVCPVEATSHNGEGLNDMTYNRCVGTRYCSNNCPYKVRRFNNFFYADYDTPALRGVYNPDVTVRTRGVMEKCTYCVQRVNAARMDAERDGEAGRRVRDGEVVTACQQACPTDAIVFGDMNDKSSRVAKLKTEPHHYALLAELNTRPRTTYLGVVKNPNPEIKS